VKVENFKNPYFFGYLLEQIVTWFWKSSELRPLFLQNPLYMSKSHFSKNKCKNIVPKKHWFKLGLY
jgi:hypothetical protein